MKVSIKWKEGLSFYVKDVEIVERAYGLISLNGFRIYRVIIHLQTQNDSVRYQYLAINSFLPVLRKFTSSHNRGVSFEFFGPVEQVPVSGEFLVLKTSPRFSAILII